MMFNPYTMFDDFVIDKIFQPVINFIWKLTGADGFKISKLVLVIIELYALSVMLSWGNDENKIFLGISVIMLCIISLGFIKEFDKETKDSHANPARKDRVIILWKILFTVCLIFSVGDMIFNTLYILFVFVVCCERPTGKKFDIKNKIKNLFFHKSVVGT